MATPCSYFDWLPSVPFSRLLGIKSLGWYSIQSAQIVDIPEPIQDMVLSNANLVDDGVAAFRSKDFDSCIRLMSRAIDKNKSDWRARMFLAMAYYATGSSFPAANHLRYLHEHCPNDIVKTRSAKALTVLEQRLDSARREKAAKKHYGGV
jgi:hypothetical protein